jgi:hypothetical protein
MDFVRFLKQFAWPVGLAIVAAVFLVLDMIGRAQEVAAFGLPVWAWVLIAAVLFLSAVILFFYQVHKRIENVGTNKAGGHLSTLLTPLPHKETKEERRDRLERKELIRQAREIVTSVLGYASQDRDVRATLETSAAYYNLRPHLSAQFFERMKSNPITDSMAASFRPFESQVPPLAAAFFVELDRLEAEWGLLALSSKSV